VLRKLKVLFYRTVQYNQYIITKRKSAKTCLDARCIIHRNVIVLRILQILFAINFFFFSSCIFRVQGQVFLCFNTNAGGGVQLDQQIVNRISNGAQPSNSQTIIILVIVMN